MYHHHNSNVFIASGGGNGGGAGHLQFAPTTTLVVGPSQMSQWKRQLQEKSSASCPHEECRLSFLSLAGIVAHFKSCRGRSDPGEYVTCDLCGHRFKLFKSLLTHQSKSHFQMITLAQDVEEKVLVIPQKLENKQQVHYSYGRSPSEGRKYETPSSSSSIYAADSESESGGEKALESPAEQAARIMAQSRLISTPRRRGRPRKHEVRVVVNTQNLQYSDPFDMDLEESGPFQPQEEIHLMTDEHGRYVHLIEGQLVSSPVGKIVFMSAAPGPTPNNSAAMMTSPNVNLMMQVPSTSTRCSSLQREMPKMRLTDPPAVYRQLTPNPILDSRYTPERSQPSPLVSSTQRRIDSPVHSLSPTSTSSQPAEDDLEARERALVDQEVKLAEYERMVLQSEEMAKAARKAKLEEKERTLQRKQEELQKRMAYAMSTLQGSGGNQESEGMIHKPTVPIVLPSMTFHDSPLVQVASKDLLPNTMSNLEVSIGNKESEMMFHEPTVSIVTPSRTLHNKPLVEAICKDTSIDTVSTPERFEADQVSERVVHNSTVLIVTPTRTLCDNPLVEVACKDISHAISTLEESRGDQESEKMVQTSTVNIGTPSKTLHDKPLIEVTCKDISADGISSLEGSAGDKELERIVHDVTEPTVTPIKTLCNKPLVEVACKDISTDAMSTPKGSGSDQVSERVVDNPTVQIVTPTKTFHNKPLVEAACKDISNDATSTLKGSGDDEVSEKIVHKPTVLIVTPTKTLCKPLVEVACKNISNDAISTIKGSGNDEVSETVSIVSPSRTHHNKPLVEAACKGSSTDALSTLKGPGGDQTSERKGHKPKVPIVTPSRTLRDRSLIKAACKDIFEEVKWERQSRKKRSIGEALSVDVEIGEHEESVCLTIQQEVNNDAEPPMKKKRGRKPKVKQEEIIPPLPVTAEPATEVKIPKKRGRKPKALLAHPTPSVIIPPLPVTAEPVTEVKIPKKRGRKPKSLLPPTDAPDPPSVDNQKKIDVEEVPYKEEFSESGRLRRRAATAATRKLAEALTILKYNENSDDDEENFEDSEDEAFNELDVKEMYKVTKRRGSRYFICKTCKSGFEKVKEIESHIVTNHADALEGEVEDEESEIEEVDDDIASNHSSNDFSDEFDRVRGKKVPGSRRSSKSNLLEPNGEFATKEKIFRERNFDKNKFESSHTTRSDWRILSITEAAPFIPVEEQSLSYKSAKEENAFHLLRFNSRSDISGCINIFAGGPIWASSWCPTSSEQDAFLAVSCHPDFEESCIKATSESNSTPGLIQLWQFDKTSGGRMRLGIAHHFGKVWCLRWCPSGGQQSMPGYLPRLGLLAAACSDGTVRIFSVCHPDALSSEDQIIASCKPAHTLRLGPDPVNCHCLSLSWYRGLNHRAIAAGFSDGSFAVWDICQPKDSIQSYNGDILPYLHVSAHTSTVTAVDLEAVDGQEYPSLMISGSSDRFFYLWDLARSSKPLKSLRRGLITDVSWMPHRPGHAVVSFDDVFLQSGTRTAIFDFSSAGEKMKAHSLVPQNSVVWSHSYCPWLNTLICGTNAGELMMLVVPPVKKPLHHDKDLIKRRMFLFKSKVERESDETFYCKPTYAEAIQNAMVSFDDFELSDLKSLPAEGQLLPMLPDKMGLEDITSYPLAGINSVCQSSDLQSVGLIFSGGQSGIGRVLTAEFLNAVAKRLVP